MRVAVFLPNLVGDAVMATPTLRALRQGLPDAELIGVMRPVVAATLQGIPCLDRAIVYRPSSPDHAERFRGVVAQLRAARPDLALLLPNSFRSALMARLGGARRVIGYARGGRRWLLSDSLPPRRDAQGRYLPTPAVETYLALARRLGCPVQSPRLELVLTPDEQAAADLAWQRLGLTNARPIVALNTGGAFGPAKNWPVEHFATLATRLAEFGASVLVLCGPAERETARDIVRRCGHPNVCSLADQTIGLELTKASLTRCALLITTDSGPRHIATAFGIPVITLFGPTFIEWTRTHHPRALHLRIPVPCGPCQQPTCPEGHHRCMVDLQPEPVFQTALRLLGGQSIPATAPPPMALGRLHKLGHPTPGAAP